MSQPVADTDHASAPNEPTVVLPAAEYRALRETADNFELVLRATGEGWWEWDLVTGAVRFSRRFRQQLGYDGDDRQSVPDSWDEWVRRVHPDDLERTTREIESYVEGRFDRLNAFYRLQHRDGSYRWFHAHAGSLAREAEDVRRFIAAQTDIHDQLLVQEQLRESERRQATLLGNLPGMAARRRADRTLEFASEGALELTGYRPEALIAGRPAFNSLVNPDDQAHLLAAVEEAAGQRRPFQLTYRITTAAGEEKWLWEQGQVVRDILGDISGYESFAIDITHRVRAFEVMEQRVHERTRELQTLLEVSRGIASILDLETLIQTIFEQTERVVPYDAASIGLVNDDTLSMVATRRKESAASSTSPVGIRFKVEQVGPIWSELAAGLPVMTPDVNSDDPIARAWRMAVGKAKSQVFPHVVSWLAAPMHVHGRFIGAIFVTSNTRDFYTAHQADLVTAMANQVAVALENARLHEQGRTLAAVEERQRLARELHDSVSQALYGIGLGARTARTLLDRDPARATEPLDYVLQLAEAGLAEMRALIFELRPESLVNEGLVAALEKQAAAIRARHSMAVEASLGDEPEAPLEVKEALYRIAQEAMHNTVKHGQATSISLRLAREGGRLALDVRDDGRGFDTSGSFPGHLGLKSMRERSARLGGLFRIESAPGAGTHVHVEIGAEAAAASD